MYYNAITFLRNCGAKGSCLAQERKWLNFKPSKINLVIFVGCSLLSWIETQIINPTCCVLVLGRGASVSCARAQRRVVGRTSALRRECFTPGRSGRIGRRAVGARACMLPRKGANVISRQLWSCAKTCHLT